MVMPLLRAIRRLETLILVVLLATMIGLAGGQIILRNLFDSGLSWSDPLLRLLVLWVGMLGAMIATQQDRHIRIDLLTRYIPAQWHHYTTHLNHFFSAVVCALLAWHSARFVYFEWQDGATVAGALPAWMAEAILPFGFGVMALRFALLLAMGRTEGAR